MTLPQILSFGIIAATMGLFAWGRLRAGDPDIQAGLGMAGADPVAVFTELRERKNNM